jgi:predicted nucleic acid-binding protein
MNEAAPELMHLDTNFLIHAYERESDEREIIDRWILEEVKVQASAVAWMEFLRGKTSKARPHDLVIALRLRLADELFPFDEHCADEAANLFRRVGRPREAKLRCDCMIAACAIVAGAQLATRDSDFGLFELHGLHKAKLEN